jgi:hypothetical protein
MEDSTGGPGTLSGRIIELEAMLRARSARCRDLEAALADQRKEIQYLRQALLQTGGAAGKRALEAQRRW